MNPIPILKTDSQAVNQAFRIAIGDIFSNISPLKRGILEEEEPCLLAGMFFRYNHCFTRDISINCWNGASLFLPDICKNSMRSVLESCDDLVLPGQGNGEYWDSISWIIGTWEHFLLTDDEDFLRESYAISKSFMAYMEETHLGENGLFKGPSFINDGPASFPDAYVAGCSKLDWMLTDKMQNMQCLSTNCLYYAAYITLSKMNRVLFQEADPQALAKAAELKDRINDCFWSQELGRYTYIESDLQKCDRQEAMGLALAILYGIADQEKVESIYANVVTTPWGIASIYPVYERYQEGEHDQENFGRTCGTIWPQVNAFWAQAALAHEKTEIFDHEFNCLTQSAVTHEQFLELYHPITGARYGGMQEAMGSLKHMGDETMIVEWDSRPRQTWAATAYLRMNFFGIAGMRIDELQLSFSPYLPEGINAYSLRELTWGNKQLDISIRGQGGHIQSIQINGETKNSIKREASGHFEIEIELAK